MKYSRKILKFLGKSAAVLLLLFLLIYVLIQQPTTQTWLVQKVTSNLSEKLNSKVEIESVNIEFFKTAVLENIYIEDQNADTLLFSNQLKVDIGLFSLFQKEIFLNKVHLQNGVVNLVKNETDTLFNIENIIRKLNPTSSENKNEQKSTNQSWAFGLENVVLENIQFKMLEAKKSELKTDVGFLSIDSKTLDFKNKKIDLSKLRLENSTVAFSIFEKKKENKSTSSEFSFPNIGWEITSDELNFDKTQFSFSNLNFKRNSKVVDYNYLNLADISLTINDLSMKENDFSGKIKNAKLVDHSGFKVKKLETEIQVTDKKITAKNLFLETPQTRLKNEIKLSFNQFSDLLDFSNKVKLESSFAPSRVAFRDVWQLVATFRQIPNVKTELNETINIFGNVLLENDKLTLKNLDSQIPNDLIFQADGSISNLSTKPKFDVLVKKMQTNYPAILKLTKDFVLPKGFDDWGEITFAGEVRGTIDDLQGTNLNLTTERQTFFKGDLTMKGLPEIENTFFTGNIENLTTQASELQGFSESPLPPFLDSIGLVNFKGNFDGTISKFEIAGDFETSGGDIQTDLDMDFEDDFSSAKYNGKLDMKDFDLSIFLGEQFGKVTFEATVGGEGLNVNDLDTKVDALIPSFVFQNYNYQNLKIDGAFLKKQFEGKANIQDENLAFDFLGKVNLNDSLPVFDLEMALDTINFRPLNLYQKDLGFSGFVNADFQGNNLDNIFGTASLNAFSITQDSLNYNSQKESLLNIGEDSAGGKNMIFRSEFMDADIRGNFNFRELPNALFTFVNDYFSIEEFAKHERFVEADFKEKNAFQQDFNFDFEFKDLAGIVQVFVPKFHETDTAFLKGNFDSKNQQLQFRGEFPNVIYDGVVVDTLRIDAQGTPQELTTQINLTETRSDSSFHFPKTSFETVLANDSLKYGVNIWDDVTIHLQSENVPKKLQRNTKLQLEGTVAGKEKGFLFSFSPKMILNNEKWNIDNQNTIFYDNKGLIVSSLEFLKDKQTIKVNSKGGTPDTDYAPIEVSFLDFNLSEISDVLGLENHYVKGNVNGAILLKEIKNNLHYNSDLTIDSLTYNEEHLGQVNIQASQSESEPKVNVNVLLQGANEMVVKGNYFIPKNTFDLDFDFRKVSIALADSFLKEIIKDSEGHFSGEAKLKGSLDEPKLKGQINLHDASTLLILSNTRYKMNLASIRLTENLIDLGKIELKDVNENEAILTGEITHDFFQNLNLDLDFSTDAFQVLQTKVGDNDLYYGNLFMRAKVAATGPLELPKLDVVATTLPQSELFVQPFLESQIIEKKDYIIFGNPETFTEDSLLIVEQNIVNKNIGFDLSLNLTVTKDAKLNIIVDPLTGDNLISSGTSNLTINMNPKGEISVVGDYTIEEGKYSMIYEQLIKRDFEIEKGSNISFSGDPLKAKFNITAVYKVRTTTTELIKNETNDTELKTASYRQDVRVLLYLKGDLEEPLISFDIEIPSDQATTISSPVAIKLAELRERPNELNTQVFGLLFFNGFIVNDGTVNSALADMTESIALSSVSKLISNQLNRLADKYIKGVEVNLNLESHRSGVLQENTVTQMQLNLSKQLFNDRLTIKVGTNVNLDTGKSGISETDFSAFAGDFVLEYKINEAGNYYVRVFHKSDYNILEDANTNKTGAGIILKKSFNSKKYKE